MTFGVRYYTPNPAEFDANGNPFVGAQLFFYVTGTTTPLNTYSDVSLSVPNPNPVVADADGRFGSIFLGTTQAYKIALYGPNPDPSIPSTPASPQGVQQWTEDPCGPAAGGANVNSAGIIGEVRMFAGGTLSIPAQWYLCYGQAVSRTTYSAAFGVLGTAFGSGDGSTTFNLPDIRGRALAGLDNMGGTAASRLTAGVSGIPATTLGGAGGGQISQADTLTAISTVTDPGHSHTTSSSGGGASDGSNFLQGGTVWDLIRGVATNSATTSITVSTTVTSSLTGTTQNVQPTMVLNAIIYLGA